jgi:putative MATE family efflux protein
MGSNAAIQHCRRETRVTQSRQRQIARIAVPVSLEYIVMLGLNFVNQIIVGGLGAVAIAAVGFANSLTFILTITLSALGLSVQMLVARAFGAKRVHDVNHLVTYALIFAVSGGGVLSLVLALFPHQILTLTGASVGVASMGSTYLMLTALTLAPNIVSSVLSSVMRATDHAKAPLHATTVAVVLNTALSYVLVYGWGSIPALGVAGAGWATLITAVLKASILYYQTFFGYKVGQWEAPSSWRDFVNELRPVFVTAIPFGFTELVWTLGIFSYNVITQRLGDEPLAASQISNTLEGIFITGSIGLASAATALINRAIGAGDVAAAEGWKHTLLRAGLVSGAVFGALFGASAVFVPAWFGNAGTNVQQLAVYGVIVNAFFQIVKVRNMILAGGVLASGNQLRGIIWGDVTGALFVGVPLAIILGLFTPLGYWGILAARAIDELGKLVVFEWNARRINWNKVVADHAQDTTKDSPSDTVVEQ